MGDFKQWNQRKTAKSVLLFPENLGKHLSLDETAFTHGELYTIITNKAAKGKKGSIIAMLAGTSSEVIIPLLKKLPLRQRNKVEEITLDMAGSMNQIAKKCFPNATLVTDRFHVQKLALEGVQEMRIKHRWAALDKENSDMEKAKRHKKSYRPEILENGDTMKQLLARSRYVLFKSQHKWTNSQANRAELLFKHYPDLQKAYNLSQGLKNIFQEKREKYMLIQGWPDGTKKYLKLVSKHLTQYLERLPIITKPS